MNDYTHLISVVMPVYNGEKYLNEAIDSVLNQTFKDFEFIIINDGSTDKTEEIIKGYSDKRIKYIKQENTGIGGALRKGCNIASGKYIARMDADDVCLPNRFKVQFDFLEKNKYTVLVSSSVLYIDENSRVFGRSYSTTSNRAIKNKLKRGCSAISHPSLMMRNDIYKKTVGYQDLQPLEDYCLWVNMSKYGQLRNISFPLLKYRVLSNSISRSISTDRRKELRNFIRKREFVLSNEDIAIFRELYANAKKEFAYKTNSETLNGIVLNTSFELKIIKFFRSIGVREKLIEFVLCNLKNL